MQFLSPFALLYLPAIAAVLLLARRRVIRVRRTVGALYLWEASDPRNPQAAPRFRWRRTWLVIVQAALMITLALALAAPSLMFSRPRAAFLIDVSASMGAREEGGTRFDLARRAALAAVDALPRGTLVDLWTTDGSVAVARDVDGRRISTALSRLALSDGGADLAAAVAAVRATDTSPLYVFSDRTAPEPADPQVRWITVGRTQPNVAITSLATRQVQSPVAVTEIVVGIRNFGGSEITAPFEIQHDSAGVFADRIRVPGRGMMTATLRIPAISGVVTARLTDRDALDVDNVRYAIASLPLRRRALLVTPGNFFLERALASVPGLALEIVRPGGAVSGQADYDLVVCDGCETVPPTVPTILLRRPVSSTAPAPLRVVSAAHPVVKFVNPLGLSETAIPGPPLSPSAVVLARAGDAPVVVASDVSGQRVVDLRLDLRESSLVLQPAFPILLANAVAWVTRDGDNPSVITAGQPLRWTVDAGPSVSARGPDGHNVPVSVNANKLAIASTGRMGVYEINRTGSTLRFAVNPATETESDLTVEPQTAAPAKPPTLPGTPTATHLAVALLLTALLLLIVETALSTPLTVGARAFRAVLAVLVALAAIGPRIPIGTARMDVLFLVDRSSSMAGDVDARTLSSLNQFTGAMRAGDRAGVIVFGADAAVERAPEPALRIAAITSRPSVAATDISAALRLARRQLTPGRLSRAVLLSDGQQTAGDALSEAARAAADGLPVDVFPLSADPSAAGAFVTAVTVPPHVRSKEPFLISMEVQGKPGARVDIDLRRDGDPMAAPSVTIRHDGTGAVDVSDVQVAPGVHTYTASVRVIGGQDGMAEAGGMVTVSGQPSLLYVTSGSPTLGHLFIDAGWAVRTLEPAALPGIAARLRDFDAVVIENGDASRLTPTQVTGLTEYVQNMAGGLLVLGGTSTLASFRTSPLAGILPVDVRPRTGARRPGMALVLAFDKSGSMADVVGGVSKIELARQSVLGAVQAIPSTDLFGAIAFDSGPRIIAPLAAGNDVTNITQRLRALEAGGSTAIAPAIDLAETWLRQSGVSRKRVLLVTDGRTAEADTERLRQAVRSGQFELSVVAIGNDADRSLLTSLATTSGGRAYFPTDVGELPRIVARDAAGGSSGTTVNESFFARVLPHGMTRGIDPATPPRLTGYSVTAAKSGADVVITSHLDDPVLAAWRAGLGRVAVFTSDIDSANARTFATWPAFRQLWSQAIRWVGRQADSTGSILALDGVNQGLLAGLTFEPPDGPDRIVDARATIRSGSGTVESLPLALVSPGRFEATASLRDPGPHVASIAIRHADGRDDQIVRGVYWMPPAERPGPADRAFLEEIARTTGGRVLTSRDSPFDGDRPGEPTNVAPLLVNVALMAVIADIARKRGLFPLRTRRPVGPPRASQHAAA